MKILISGGGEPEQVKPLDDYFAKSMNGGKVLYIPVAMYKVPYNECKEWFKKTYEYCNFDIDMCTDLSKIKSLDEYTGVFIGGGNTFKLLKEIRESKFDILLEKYLKNGGFVYGGSAGAIIFGKSIETFSHADKNIVGLTELSGLNMLNGFDVWCHYNPKEDNNNIMNLKNSTKVLYEESGLLFDGKNFKSIGKDSLTYPEDFIG